MNTKPCEYCGGDISPKYRVSKSYLAKRRFCSDRCKSKGMNGERRSTYRKPKIALEHRFWSKVQKSDGGCWIWTGAKDSNGYGYLASTLGIPARKAPRVSYELHNDPIQEGLCVCHRCDNPSCVRPDHLFLGTRADNNRDRESKGRGNHAKGERVHSAKIDADGVRKIREMRAQGLSQQKIADALGLSQVSVGRVLLGKTWKHVTEHREE